MMGIPQVVERLAGDSPRNHDSKDNLGITHTDIPHPITSECRDPCRSSYVNCRLSFSDLIRNRVV
jgi:hypothetical protein